MTKNYPGEVWKEVKFDFEFANEYRLNISNFGRVKTFHKYSNGNILQGSMVNGYRIIRLKFFKPRDAQTQVTITQYQQKIIELNKKIKLQQQNNEAGDAVEVSINLLNDLKKKLSKQYKIDEKKRIIHYHSLIHKLVAEYFCRKPSDEHTIVAHLDFDKLNNRSSNLKWMTRKENFGHQQKSPFVIAVKSSRKTLTNTAVAKLTVTKVMLLKKMLNQCKPMRTLVKQFKITNTQILRIKRGENWADIPAAT